MAMYSIRYWSNRAVYLRNAILYHISCDLDRRDTYLIITVIFINVNKKRSQTKKDFTSLYALVFLTQ